MIKAVGAWDKGVQRQAGFTTIRLAGTGTTSWMKKEAEDIKLRELVGNRMQGER